MEELMKRTRLRLSLLSDGAECIFISKKFFQRHAGAETLRTVNGMVGRYPTEEFIRHQLEEQSEWSSFRKEVVRGVLEKREEKLDLPSILQAHWTSSSSRQLFSVVLSHAERDNKILWSSAVFSDYQFPFNTQQTPMHCVIGVKTRNLPKSPNQQ